MSLVTVVTLSCPPSDHLSLSGLRRHLRHRHSQLGRVMCRAVSCCSHLSRRDIAQIFPVISVWSSRQSAGGIPGCEDDKQALIRSWVQRKYKYGVRAAYPSWQGTDLETGYTDIHHHLALRVTTVHTKTRYAQSTCIIYM